MMKKLLFLSVAVLAMAFSARSQSPGTPVQVTDTLHYYFNKFYFKSGQWNIVGFPYYKSAASTVTNVTHVGSIFENSDTIRVFGLEAFAAKNLRTSQTTVKIHLYLNKLDGNGLPIMPPVDSVPVVLSSTLATGVGGNFATPRLITGNFAVTLRNMSTIAGDTALIMRTASKTSTAWPNATWAEKYGEGYGVARFNGAFRTVTNFTANGFGYGTDYEFAVAPRVTYWANAAEQWPAQVVNQETVCTSTPMTFKNVSSPQFTHRMWNLLEFYRKWNQPIAPLVITPAGGWPADSAITWKFDNEDNPSTGGKIHLAYGNNPSTINFQTDSAFFPRCSDQNFFRANLKKMNLMGKGAHLSFSEQFIVCVQYCNGDTVGIRNFAGYGTIKVYPNPSVGGKTTVSGLSGKNTLMVYDMLGQLVSSEVTDKEKATLNLGSQPNGAYVLRIVSDDNRSKTVNIIKRSE